MLYWCAGWGGAGDGGRGGHTGNCVLVVRGCVDVVLVCRMGRCW